MTGYVPQINAGQRDLSAHRYQSAAEHFRYAMVFDRSGLEAHVGLGNVYLKSGLRERAIQQFVFVLGKSPHYDAAERGIEAARSPAETDDAFKALASDVERSPKEADLLTTYSEELITRGRLDEATGYATKALSENPKMWHAHCALGRIAFAQGRLQEAIDHLTLAVNHDNDDDDAIEALGNIQMAQNHPQAAAKWFRQLIAILPEEADGHEDLASALSKMGDQAGAEAERRIADHIKDNAKGAAE
jgi:Flp pilus assembly protein TadD